MASQQRIAQRIAQVMLGGFDRHYELFRACSASAKPLFDDGRWVEVQRAVRDRIAFYDERVKETIQRLQGEFRRDVLDDVVWQQAKLYFIGELLDHKQPELAETFFNSVFCRIMHRTYFHNDFIFVRPAISTEFIESDPPTYRSYYPGIADIRPSLRQILLDFGWHSPFVDMERDVGYLVVAVQRHHGEWPQVEANFQIQVLNSAFYRNKGAYVIGRIVNGAIEVPFAVAVLRNDAGQLYVDTIVLDSRRISAMFSLSRAYFLVDMPAPADYVRFLRAIMPSKPRSELYTMLGLGKQGKTMFFRDLMYHLRHSKDEFVVAPGIRGLVMLVFTLPSYPYVFKVIKDVFGAGKEVDHATVRRKYLLVKQVDRVGRMADTLEFSHAAFPKARISSELLGVFRAEIPALLEEEGDYLIIKHLYIERRMAPLNIYLDQAEKLQRDDLIDGIVAEYGNAIRELAIANIFPGDMLWKNFGVTSYGRVVFYDYDEIERMTDCNFRRIPTAPEPEMEMSAEAWYPVGRNDIFPEEFATFLLTSPRVRAAFMRHHADLLDISFWQRAQEQVRAGVVMDFFPYPESLRFGRVFGGDQ